ncbi:MAG: DUF4258 domain-containing protein [bacterium]
MEINWIRKSIEQHKVKITDHADEEAVADDLTLDEIFYSVHTGEIIENYPNDFPFPSCLVFGKNKKSKMIHSVWGYNTERQISILITVYTPDPKKWIDGKRRRGDE